MAATLKARAELAALKKQIVADKLQTMKMQRVIKAYTNDNLRASRKRKLGVTVPGKADRDFTTQNRLQAMAMARERVESNPLYTVLNRARMDHIIGAGFRLMMRTGDKVWDKEVEAWWLSVRDKLDIRGIRPWGRMQRTWRARKDIDGDVGNILVTDNAAEWIQIIEADRIRRLEADKDASNDGIDFDQYGQPIKFWVVDSPSNPKAENGYDREDFVYAQRDDSERAERRRGVSLYLPTFNLGADQLEIRDAMVTKVKNETFMGLAFTIEGSDGTGFGGDAQETGPAENGVDYSKVKLLPGTNVVLGEKESVNVLETKSPGSNFLGFDRMMESCMAFAGGMARELITGDFSGINYSSARALIEIVKKRIRVEQAEDGMIATRVFNWKIARAIKRKELTPPKSLGRPWTHRWGVPGFPYLNPAQETQAMRQLIEMRMKSRSGIMADQGDDDFDDVADELQYEEDGLRERNLPSLVQSGSQPLPPQPLVQDDDVSTK